MDPNLRTTIPPAVEAAVPLGGRGSVLFVGPQDLLSILASLAPACPDYFRGQLRLRAVFAAPPAGRRRDPAAAEVVAAVAVTAGSGLDPVATWRGSETAQAQGGDLFLVDQGRDSLLFAIRDVRRELEARPAVFLRVARGEPDCTLYLAAADPYHRKLGKWFLVGLLAVVGGLRFAHAGAVGDGHAAALILGAHGSGKSTLAAAAAIAGLDVLAEGVALVDGAGRIVPFFMDGEPLLRLGARAWHEVRPWLPQPRQEPERYPSRAGGVGGVEEKVVLRLRELRPDGPGMGAGPVPVAAAWLPRVAGDPAGRLAVERLPRSAALAAVGGELEDSRIRALRAGLASVDWLKRARSDAAERWSRDFPPESRRVHGIEDFATLVRRLLREGVRLEP